jgi:signal transduction histidine kinase
MVDSFTIFNSFRHYRTILLLRTALAASLLLVWLIIFGLSEGGRLTILLLCINAIYSIGLYFYGRAYGSTASINTYWIDLAIYAAILLASSESYQPFIWGSLFAILIAASQAGMRSGLKATLASSLILCVSMLAHISVGNRPLLQNQLAPIAGILIIGFFVSTLGGARWKSERRLSFLNHITQIANPRFGAEQTISVILQLLRSFYEADNCLLVMSDNNNGEYSACRAKAGNSNRTIVNQCEKIRGDLAKIFLSLPSEHACISDEGRMLWASRRRARFFNARGDEVSLPHKSGISDALLTTLDAKTFIAVPFSSYGRSTGRLFILNPRNGMSAGDILFLMQVLDNVMRVLENIRLVDRLATEAADMERQRIARDIHDSIIQPYIGIQIGLNAVKMKVENGVDACSDINRLIQVTQTEIIDLRTYMKGLKGSKAAQSNFVQAVRRLASKFSDASNIEIEVVTDENLLINDRLAAEAFQIISEGLSNVRKHTLATKVTISINCRDEELVIILKDNSRPNGDKTCFTPRSINERATALGGKLVVERAGGGPATLRVSIPL